MSKMGQYYMELQENGDIPDFDEALYEYQHMLWLEEQEALNYKMTKEESTAYDLYMEGKLCGELTSTARLSIDMSLRNGQTINGLRKRRNIVK